MTKAKPVASAPGPLEAYAAWFDGCFTHIAQRRGFREYVTGLLAPRDRNKTLTCLAGAEPGVQAGCPEPQRLQFFLSESCWDPEKVNDVRLGLLLSDRHTAPHPGGVLVIDDSGDRKDGTATAHVGRQWLGRLGKTDNGIVTVTTLWADERLYYPLHARAYTPAHHFAKKRSDPDFRTKPQLAAALAARADQAGVTFRAVVADCGYGDHDEFRRSLREAGLPFVMALKPHRGTWAYGDQAHTPVDAARELTWKDAEHPGAWAPIERTFRDGRTETWWAAEAQLGGFGPDSPTRLAVATADPATLPEKATWYLATNLPRPGGRHDPAHDGDDARPAADLAELVRLYGLRHWVEQSYKQVKDELGWADFQVRSALAIRRHQTLVHCAFSFCWDTWFIEGPGAGTPAAPVVVPASERGPLRPTSPAPTSRADPETPPELAESPARGPLLADPGRRARALVAGMVEQAPAP